MTPGWHKAIQRKIKTAGKASFVDKIVGKVFGGPVRKGASGVSHALLGEKGRKGYTAGRRLQEVKGLKGLTEISRKEFLQLKADPKLGTAVETVVNGKTIYAKRKHLPGGIAGAIMRNPAKSAGGAFLGYHAVKSPEGRAIAGSMLPQNSIRSRSEEMVQLRGPAQGSGAWG